MNYLELVKKSAVGFWIVTGLVSCGKNNFPIYTQLSDLRILTIIPDQPEVNPGATVNFTPVLSDLNGAGRTLNYSVKACIDPGIGIGAFPSCPNPDSASIHSGSFAMTAGTSQTYTGTGATFSLTMPIASVIFASRTEANQYNGINYLVFYSVNVPNSTTSVSSFLRVTVSTSAKVVKNQNPVISSVDLNDNATTGLFSMPTIASNFRATSPASATEIYQTMNQNGKIISQQEQLVNTWFMSDGTFTYERTAANTENSWLPPSTNPSKRGSVVLVVTRDGRNGVTFQKIEMN